MVVGNLGKSIIFTVSQKRIMTFQNFTKEAKGRWAKHDRIGERPKKQFLGPDSGTIQFTIQLNAQLGVKPRKAITIIENAVKRGTPYTFILGSKRVGDNKWVITSVSESWDQILKGGELVKAKVNLTLEEYV